MEDGEPQSLLQGLRHEKALYKFTKNATLMITVVMEITGRLYWNRPAAAERTAAEMEARSCVP